MMQDRDDNFKSKDVKADRRYRIKTMGEQDGRVGEREAAISRRRAEARAREERKNPQTTLVRCYCGGIFMGV